MVPVGEARQVERGASHHPQRRRPSHLTQVLGEQGEGTALLRVSPFVYPWVNCYGYSLYTLIEFHHQKNNCYTLAVELIRRASAVSTNLWQRRATQHLGGRAGFGWRQHVLVRSQQVDAHLRGKGA